MKNINTELKTSNTPYCVVCGKPCGQKTFNRDLPFRGYFICSECYNLEIELVNDDKDNLFRRETTSRRITR